MEEAGSNGAGDVGGEVGRLQEELRKAKERLQLWKEKAQIGVNEMRKRIAELSLERDELREAYTLLKEQQQNHGVSESSLFAPSRASSGLFMHEMEQWTNATLRAFVSVLLDKSEVALDVAFNASQALDKYKQRTVQTLKLQTKNVETLNLEVSNLREQLNDALAEVRERNCSIENRDHALSVLQNRVEDLEAANARLEALQEARGSTLNVDQIHAFEERLEEEVRKLRRDFAFRENAIFDQHRDEMERLAARHEEEVAGLRAELEERALAAAAEVRVDSQRTDGVTEAAYMELMREWEALREELQVARGEKEKLVLELRDVKGRTAQGPRGGGGNSDHGGNNNGGGLVAVQREPLTLAEALVRIAELEGGMSRLSEELCEAKKRLIASKHQASAKETSRPQTLDGQQFSYMRFVVVKLLCASGDTNVAMNLFPVFSMLLHFNPDDLEQIYTANPSWARRKN